MSALPRWILVMLPLALAACAATPVHYHTLLPPIAQQAVASSPASFRIDVLPIYVPAQFDQPQLVVRQGQSGVAVLDGERWASPFGEEMRNALSSELAALLNTQNAAGVTSTADKPTLQVRVQIHRFDAWPGQRVQLAADWELGFANEPQNTRVIHTGNFEEAAAGDYGAMANACQRVVTDLAARIASDAQAMAQKHYIALQATARGRQVEIQPTAAD